MSTLDEKVDRILEKLEALAISVAVINDWRIVHTKEHENMTNWKRWIAPFALSLFMVGWQVFKK